MERESKAIEDTSVQHQTICHYTTIHNHCCTNSIRSYTFHCFTHYYYHQPLATYSFINYNHFDTLYKNFFIIQNALVLCRLPILTTPFRHYEFLSGVFVNVVFLPRVANSPIQFDMRPVLHQLIDVSPL